jgi:hypothetical protein
LGNIPERFCWLFFTEVRIRIHWILIRHQRFSWMLIGIRIHRPNWIRIRNTGFHILKSVTFTFKLVLHPNKNNQCGGSGMFIPDPGSWFLLIPDPVQKPIFKELLKFSPKKNFNMPSNICKQPTNFIGTKINHDSLWHFLLIPCSENLSFKSSKASDERNNICKCTCWKCNPF